MSEFFRTWQRKLGCITLFAALFLLGVWIRSRLVSDQVVFPVG